MRVRIYMAPFLARFSFYYPDQRAFNKLTIQLDFSPNQLSQLPHIRQPFFRLP